MKPLITSDDRFEVSDNKRLLGLACKGLLVVACWLVCSVAQVEKYLTLRVAFIFCGAGCICVAGVLTLLRRCYRVRWDVGRWALVAAFILLVASFAVLYPRSQHHLPGKGSDREDALRVELAAVVRHEYPYQARTFLNHPPTPLPGAMWLASPFFFAGRIALQNLFWAAAFLWFLLRFFCNRVTALAFFSLFVLTALENLNDLDVGGDYMTNIFYVAIALFSLVRSSSRPSPSWRTGLAVTFLGFALSSRILYVVAVPPLAALLFQRNHSRRALLLLGGVVLTSVLLTLPVFFPHPLLHLSEQLHQNSDKLAILPHVLTGNTLPVLALATASVAFFIRMDLRRMFLFTGLASLVLLLPPMACFVAAEGGLRSALTTDLEYLAVSAMFLGLWALADWEQVTSSAQWRPHGVQRNS